MPGPLIGIRRCVRNIEVPGTDIGQGTHRLDLRFHAHQHPPHVGVMHDRSPPLDTGHLALHALARIGQRLLVGPFRDRDTFEADAEPGMVHHREHAGEAAVRRSHEVSARAVEGHHAGRAAVQTQLVLHRHRLHRVGLGQTAVVVDQPLGDQEQRNTLDPRRRIRQARQYQVDHVVAHIVIPPGNENLLTADAEGVAVRLRLRAHCRQVRASLRLGQIHRASPFAADHLRQIAIL